MEEAKGFIPQTLRQPFADATNRLNAFVPSRVDHDGPYDEHAKYSDRMSITTSPLSPKGNTGNGYLSPLPDSQADSNRDSISAASIISGKGKRKTHVGPWQLGKTLGKGATGRVRLAKHAVTGQTAAIKIVSKKSAAMVQSESIAAMDRNTHHFGGSGAGVKPMPCGIEREVVIMKLIEHPNVISLYDVWENRGELYVLLTWVHYRR
jgi:serine/threonine-protein kinase HSL1 (negative regulator of Swe1 kinase)